MTGNQRVVLQWLQEHSTVSGIIRCSNSKIAEEFGWSQQYTQKTLAVLVNAGYLQELQKGTGHRPSKYQISSSSDNPFSHNKPLPLPLGRGSKTNKREGVFGRAPARIRVSDSEESLPFPQSRRQSREGPMKKFKARWDQVSKWGPTDVVCYYRWLYYTRYKVMPAVDWSICCGTARTLLKRLGSPKSVKRYLQIAFSIITWKPQGLNSLYHSTLYERVRGHWDDNEDLWDDYTDDWVFPWLKQVMLEESRKFMQEYNRQHVLKSFSPEHRARVEKERKERLQQVMLRSIKSNWDLYSMVGR